MKTRIKKLKVFENVRLRLHAIFKLSSKKRMGVASEGLQVKGFYVLCCRCRHLLQLGVDGGKLSLELRKLVLGLAQLVQLCEHGRCVGPGASSEGACKVMFVPVRHRLSAIMSCKLT